MAVFAELNNPVDAFCKIKYDYVIVGGGTAGLVVAARLSEDENVNVAVLEAGELRLDDPIITTPLLSSAARGNPTYDWLFETIPQTTLNNRAIKWPRGKLVGGSSCINSHVFVRASPEEYDDWEALGNKGWNWKNLAPYFKKAETFRPIPDGHASIRQANEMTSHGTTGPLETTICNDINESNVLWIPAWNNLGVKTVLAGAESPVGAQFTKSTISSRTGQRSSSLSAYYMPNADRPNLHLLPKALVSKVLFTRPNDELIASGVEFTVGDKRYEVKATSEVILCAGVVKSPTLLELSGIGSRSILEAYGVETLVDNKGVGENLQDHAFTIAAHQVLDSKYSLDSLSTSPELAAMAMAEYTATKTGLFSTGTNVSTYISYDQIGLTAPKISNVASTHSIPGLEKQYDLLLARLRNPNVPAFQFTLVPTYSPWLMPEPKPEGVKDCLSIMNCVVAPFSRGSIHIQSSNPGDNPVIDPRYLEHYADQDIFTAASRQGLKLAATAPLSDALDKCIVPALPLSTDEEYKDFARRTLGTFYHPIGTCSMLPREDGGVVDSSLVVYGTSNLRVVDASIFPLHISGNIQWTVYAVAERAADLIKQGALIRN
ncbi:hypothetical protein POJ06DRAFT_146011 [Lipomyces tetrasporus]|uniref:alcohol oxidase n=1 Tax=Lipomyces tetrasporus TaxID=54092 RepID=A0AAD7VRI3_9ASCO|nr:uncharacterized protein POJ06DRAFT_146011 [Lipomyces tetrasporus]KAJ8098155.1 hypothetical protein POJ06DRAFT_146011 [Lipomyces tetrasporus]